MAGLCKRQIGQSQNIATHTPRHEWHNGDGESVGGGVSEMKIDDGPGFRVYFTRRGAVIYLLLLGGDKSAQSRDIERAKFMAASLEE
ncbi:type II toxin-antitoxin system RelE/ParE family toxin [Iodobacter fluviatilis]|uniref:type II toxin-antitoxin system RelE/ParE family toxin n=1 Tax=Iodobacter fluviatilis TaxID=537 RepID=UPI0021CD19B4|nr:type II toxin-antitoxin system RelE/ParE family toxin [Iodobacter fluviatilis]